ncbi:hypothetical protein B296_00036584 [Ensete ventricosum]|uniref:Uncharacterized protein n=1 Tax=Ensete ventricosum TaxID=4639 RepID=A0A426XK89_ENSVE|nr:hypothetical protein B296_00036584 [Ensete ventricosum]
MATKASPSGPPQPVTILDVPSLRKGPSRPSKVERTSVIATIRSCDRRLAGLLLQAEARRPQERRPQAWRLARAPDLPGACERDRHRHDTTMVVRITVAPTGSVVS